MCQFLLTLCLSIVIHWSHCCCPYRFPSRFRLKDDSSLYCYGLYGIREVDKLSFYQMLYVFYDAYKDDTIAVMIKDDGMGIYYGNRMVLLFRMHFEDQKNVDNVKVLSSDKTKSDMFCTLTIHFCII